MRGQKCEKDVGTKVAAFSQYLESTNPHQDSPNLTTENVELLTNFAKFLQHQKNMHSHDHHKGGHGHSKHDDVRLHGKFGKLRRHELFVHHMRKHDPYAIHNHSFYGHHDRHHWDHGKYGSYLSKYYVPDPHFGNRRKMGHHLRKHIVCSKANPGQTTVIEDNESAEREHNPSPPPQVNTTAAQVVEESSEVNNARCVCHRKDRHCGRRWRNHEWVVFSKLLESMGPSQPARNQPPQDLATMVENINIVNEESSNE